MIKRLLSNLVWKIRSMRQEPLTREVSRSGTTSKPMVRVFMYGSLKRGFCNHYRVGEFGAFIGTDRVRGFTLVTLGYYPGAIASPADEITGEVWDVPQDLYVRIEQMERGAGYCAERVRTAGGRDVWMFEYMGQHYGHLSMIGSTWTLAHQDGLRRRAMNDGHK